MKIPHLDIAHYPELDSWREMASKRVMHLSQERGNTATIWRSGEIQGHIEQRLEVVRQVANVVPADNWIGDRPATTNLIVGFVDRVAHPSSFNETGPARSQLSSRETI